MEKQLNAALRSQGLDPSVVICTDIGNAIQVKQDGLLLGYVMKEGWYWKGSMKAK